MPLSTGSRLGPYEVVAPIGAGGMGEVYRARDTRLGREVALKVLPAEFAEDSVRRQRFEQEARAASALNHPNIVSVYDIGNEGDIRFIVTELVDGEALRVAIQRGPMALRKALDLAAQVADGLAAAHAADIVHRDLKPDNIMITRQGRAKILDFGLAKYITPSPAKPSDVTQTVAKTLAGTVMGTAGYMAPEQVRGQGADHRADIFSFGAVLYEMLSGARAFSGASPADTMSAILNQEPADLPATIPPSLARVVRRCLEKEPQRRFQSAQDLEFAIQDLSLVSTASGAMLSVTAKLARRRFLPALVGLAVVVAAAAGFLGAKAFWKTAPPVFQQLTFRRGMVSGARFAPDGRTILYSAAWDGGPNELFLTRVGSPESRSLGLPGARLFAVSSTGEIALALNARYLWHNCFYGTLARVSMSGGVPREVLKDVYEADWAPNGEELAVVHMVEGAQRLEYPIGKVLYETAGWISYIHISPKGDRIAFLDHPTPADDRGSVTVVDLAGKKTTLSSGWESLEGLTWTPTGSEVWFAAAKSGHTKSIYAVTLAGGERIVTRLPAGVCLWDISADSRVLLENQTKMSEMLGVSGAEKRERNLTYLDNSRPDELSPDGKTLLFTEQGEAAGANYAVCMRGIDGSPALRLGEGRGMSLSPDGKWVLARLPTTPPQLVVLPTGSGEARRLAPSGISYGIYAGWFPDSRRILVGGNETGRHTRIWVESVDDAKPRAITPEGTLLVGEALSPDGKLAAAKLADGGVAIYPVEGESKGRPVPGIGTDERFIRWDSTGRRLYFYKPSELPCRVYSVDLESGKRELVKEFMPSDHTGIFAIRSMVLSPDGGGAVYGFYRITSDLYLVSGLQ